MRHATPRILTCLFLTSVPALALQGADETPEGKRRGLTAPWPAGLITTGASEPVRIKATGDQNVPTLTPPTQMSGDASKPDQALNELFTSHGDLFTIDALSTGNAMIPPATEGALQIGNAWMGIALSVADGVRGDPGSHFDLAHLTHGSAGAHIIGYYLSGSQDLDTELVGHSLVEMNPAHIGLVGTSDITAFDLGLGAMRLPSMGTSGPSEFFPRDNRAYFSVTPGFATSPGGANFAIDQRSNPSQQTPNHNAHPGDIYMLYYTGAVWTGPYLWARAVDLGLAAGDLDALDLDFISLRVIYSGTALSGLASQLMLVQLQTGGTNNYVSAVPGSSPVALKEENGVKITTRVHINDTTPAESDEIDAICVIDPEASATDTHFGIPYTHAAGVDPMGLGMVRTDASMPGEWHVQVNGWGGLPGQTGIAGTVILYEVSSPGSPGGPSSTGIPVAMVPRLQSQASVALQYVPNGLQPGEVRSVYAVQLDRNRNVVGTTWWSKFEGQ